jgi:beta-galactosidase
MISLTHVFAFVLVAQAAGAEPARPAMFPFGGQYVPVAKATEVPMSEWDHDIGQLRQLGFTAFRCFVAWDRIEKEEGRRDYTMLDRALDLAQKHGVKVTVNIGGVFDNLEGIYPPPWLVHRCQQPINNAAGAADSPRPSGPRQRICLDDPRYRQKAADFLAATVKHIAGHPALHSWVVWNEPHHQPCYCPHTQERFRAWLRAKYGKIDALVRAWSLEFPVVYHDWAEVTPPSGVGFLDGGYQPWLDWQTFLQDNMAQSMQWVARIVKQNDPLGHPTTTNLTPGDVTDPTKRCTDPWKIGRVLDVQGYSAYTLWDAPKIDPADMAVRYARLRSTSVAPGRQWFIIETEAGPMYWVHGSAPRYTALPDRILRYWQAVAHGAKSIFAWMYRSRIANAQAGEFGMLAWDGSVTERAKATGQMSAVLQRHAQTFLERVPRAEVAILAAQSTNLLYAAETHEASPGAMRNFWTRSWQGVYRLLWRLRVPADFVDDDQVAAAGDQPASPRPLAGEGPGVRGLANYKVLFVPFHVNVSARLARGLRAFIEAGGTVIADFPLGFKDDGGVVYGRSPGAGLQEVFGCWNNDALPTDSQTAPIKLRDGARLAPLEFSQSLHLLPGAEVLGTWSDGTAAIVSHRLGRGRTILAGTLLFWDTSRQEDVRLGLVREWLAGAGVKPVAEVDPLDQATQPRRIEVAPLYCFRSAGRPLYVVLNHSETAAHLRVRIAGQPAATAPIADLVGGASLHQTAGQPELSFEMTLAPKAVAAVLGTREVQPEKP